MVGFNKQFFNRIMSYTLDLLIAFEVFFFLVEEVISLAMFFLFSLKNA